MIDIWFIVLTNTQGLMVGPLQAIQGAAETGQAGGETGQPRQLQRGAEDSRAWHGQDNLLQCQQLKQIRTKAVC